jgi:valyl-tRNA synthetase
MVEAWPQDKLKVDKKASKDFSLVQSMIVSVRNIRSVYKIDPQKKVNIVIVSKKSNILESQQEIIKRLARVENIEILKNSPEIENSACIVLDQAKIYVLLGGIIDIAKEKDRLQKEVTSIEGYISGLDKRLKNKEFVKKAPAAVVEKERENLLNAKAKLAEAKKYLADLH